MEILHPASAQDFGPIVVNTSLGLPPRTWAQATTGETAMRNKRHKILVVDDEHVIASTLATILGYQGYETATAYSGEEAIQVACSFQPNFILSDIMMGAMNGVEAAIEILRTLPKCRVLFISGNAGYRDLLKEARAEGFNFEVLEKPIPPPQLLAKISQILLCRPAQLEQLAV
jgi:CheY-like chemotaxis protein